MARDFRMWQPSKPRWLLLPKPFSKTAAGERCCVPIDSCIHLYVSIQKITTVNTIPQPHLQLRMFSTWMEIQRCKSPILSDLEADDFHGPDWWWCSGAVDCAVGYLSPIQNFIENKQIIKAKERFCTFEPTKTLPFSKQNFDYLFYY